MASTRPLRFLVAAFAAAAAFVMTAVDTAVFGTVHCWRRASGYVSEWVDRSLIWLVAKFPAPARDWSTDFFRVPASQVGMGKRMTRVDRPRVMPAWRMCPST